MTVRIIRGDCREALRALPDCFRVNCCVTSPPYFGLRDYGHADQIGLEPTPDEYVATLVDVFREVKRVLRDDGTVWLNLGDSYAGSNQTGGTNSKEVGRRAERMMAGRNTAGKRDPWPGTGIKAKDLIGIPWRVAFALQADGWYLRSDIIWHKPNPMPESVTDRPTKSHEYLFLLAKSERYHYDAAAISEVAIHAGETRVTTAKSFAGQATGANVRPTGNAVPGSIVNIGDTRNRRTVWTVATQPFSGAHFATFPPALIEPCILAGCPEGGTVLDPFGGAGTTGLVADRLQRNALLIEINEAYADMAQERIRGESPMFAEVVA